MMKVRHSGGHPTDYKNYETHCFVDHRGSCIRTRRLRQGQQARLLRSRFQKRKGLQEVVLSALEADSKRPGHLKRSLVFFCMHPSPDVSHFSVHVSWQIRETSF